MANGSLLESTTAADIYRTTWKDIAAATSCTAGCGGAFIGACATMPTSAGIALFSASSGAILFGGALGLSRMCQADREEYELREVHNTLLRNRADSDQTYPPPQVTM